MRAYEFIKEDKEEWVRMTPDDLPPHTPLPSDSITPAKKNPKDTDTNKQPWWRSTTTNPVSKKIRQELNNRAAFASAFHDPERIADLSKYKPIKSTEYIFPAGGGDAMKIDNEFKDEYTVGQEKARTMTPNSSAKMPEVTPNSEMMPDVKIRRPQV